MPRCAPCLDPRWSLCKSFRNLFELTGSRSGPWATVDENKKPPLTGSSGRREPVAACSKLSYSYDYPLLVRPDLSTVRVHSGGGFRRAITFEQEAHVQNSYEYGEGKAGCDVKEESVASWLIVTTIVDMSRDPRGTAGYTDLSNTAPSSNSQTDNRTKKVK